MYFLQIIFATVVTLGLLVTIHEYGHFWVARRCGVKVLRFSIGFGKPLCKWLDRHGTEFVIAAIPLGGYVKMLDEREAPVEPELVDQAFNQKKVGQRIAIVVAGPAANFLFAIFAYWLMFSIGTSTVVPVIGKIGQGTPASLANIQQDSEIVAVNGVETLTWEAVSIQLLSRIGDSGQLNITTRQLDSISHQSASIPIQEWLRGVEEPRPLGSLGIKPYSPSVLPRLGQVVSGGAGEKAGLQVSDLILAAGGEPINFWQDLVAKVQASPNIPIELKVEREGRLLSISVVPEAKSNAEGQIIGHLGVASQQASWPESLLREIRYPVFSAILPAVEKTWDMTILTLDALKKMLVGDISVKNLSGPITIAKVAGDSVERGAETFLNFLAYLSISLGLINILPIPVLDGGHLMYYLVELVRGKPVPEKIQNIGLRIGISLILALMSVAIFNDLMRL